MFCKIVTCICAILFITSAVHAEVINLIGPDGSDVTIYRDYYGVPHIYSTSETGVIFGQGFAAARDRLFQMDILRRAAEGKLAEVFGPDYLEQDLMVRTVFYTPVERQEHFDSLSTELQNVLIAYTAGINTYIDSIGSNPLKYEPIQFQSTGIPIEYWTVLKSVALIELIAREFGQIGGKEHIRYMELMTYGWTWFNANRPINDPNAPTTIPGGSLAPSRNYHYSGVNMNPDVVREMVQKTERKEKLYRELGIPEKFGSFAAMINPSKSYSGNVMLLGCPQMGDPELGQTSICHEVELNCPELQVGGMTIAGIPLVIIGHTDNHAWTFTTGYTDNTDLYIEILPDTILYQYYFNNNLLTFDFYTDTVKILGLPDYYYDHARSVHGPVVDIALQDSQAYTWKMTFWEQELDMMEAGYDIIKAQNAAEFAEAIRKNPLSFNVFYIDKQQNNKYWHIGKYQDRTDGVDPRLPHLGVGTEEWGGFIPFDSLPHAENPSQGYFVNWNNKPAVWWNNGDNVQWHDSTWYTIRVLLVDDYISPLSPITFEELKMTPFAINDHGTYQQAVELGTNLIRDKNIAPPGQSEFISLMQVPSPHIADQWPLHLTWQFKDMFVSINPALDFDASPLYLNPQSDSVHINADILHLTGNQISVYAMINSLDGTISDSVELAELNKENTTWDGYWKPNVENHFEATIKTINHDVGTTYNSYMNSNFTTVGPVTVTEPFFVGDDSIISAGDTLQLKLNLSNDGSTVAANNVSAELFCLDTTLAEIISVDSPYYGDIDALDSKLTIGQYNVKIKNDTNTIISFKVDIYSDSIYYWCDSLEISIPVSIQIQNEKLPHKFSLNQNYPNPFNPVTKIKFQLPQTEYVTLKVYNVLGQEVATLVSKKLKADYYEYDWNASAFASGVYFYRIEAGQFSKMRKMVLIK